MKQNAGLLLLIIIVAVGAAGVWAISDITNHNPTLNLTATTNNTYNRL